MLSPLDGCKGQASQEKSQEQQPVEALTLYFKKIKGINWSPIQLNDGAYFMFAFIALEILLR